MQLVLHDLLGREIAGLPEGLRPAGAYFVRTNTGRATTTRKAVVLR